MSDRKSETEIPSYIGRRSGRSGALQGAEPSDFVWVSEDGSFEPGIEEDHVGPSALLGAVLKAVIAKNKTKPGQKHRSDEARLASALNALLCNPLQSGKSNRSEYDECLRQLASDIFLQRFGFCRRVPLDTAIRNALAKHPKHDLWCPDEWQSRIKTVRNRFAREKDRLLLEASLTRDLESAHKRARVDDVLSALKAIGIETEALQQP